MVCKTIQQMRRVAHAGALKMPEQGYTWQCGTLDGCPVIEVRKDADTMYRVDLSIGEGWCTCKFHEANRHLSPATVCKHVLYASWMLEAEQNCRIHANYREIVRNGGGLGLIEVSADSRLVKIFAHPADDIEAALI